VPAEARSADDADRDATPGPAGTARSGSGLDERGAAVLAFEQAWWSRGAAKEDAIRREFGLSAARYYQVLNALIDTPAAIAHDPMLVRRLQRVREARMAARAARPGRAPRDARDRPRLDD